MIKFKFFKKFCSMIISACLLITSLQGLAFSMPAPVNVMPAVMQPQQINTNIVPFNIGHVTETAYNGDGKVTVLIQDLHSHKQTQENINSILKILDKKYGIKNIWLEGASGNLDTSWFASIKDKVSEDKMIRLLLEKGRLTGAELFSIKENKFEILKGLENREVYLTNFERLKEIYNKKSEIETYLPKIKAILNAKIAKYFSRENRKIDVLREANLAGQIKPEKYFYTIFRATKKAGIDLNKYGQIVKYLYAVNNQKDLNLNKARKQIKELLAELKDLMPYQQYKLLTDKAGNKETETDFYTDLKKAVEEKNLSEKYKDAEKFFEYLAYREMLNPIEFAEQETELINEIELNFAQTGYEKEVLFLKKYFGFMESYLNNKITADEYKYFENNRERFKTLWSKYIDVDGIIDIDRYFDLFDNFYKDNIERNRYFIENITGTKPAAEKNTIMIKGSESYNAKVVEQLDKDKNGIEVVVAGGFHTRGLSRLFEEEKINYMVITPNVTEDVLISERLYENMFAEEYEIVKEKFANMPVTALINEIINKAGAIESIREVNGTIEFVTKKEIIRLGIDGTINEKTIKEKKKDRKLSLEQAEITANAFLSLQEYLKKQRENERRKNIGEASEDINALKERTEKFISKIEDKSLRKTFSDKLGIKNVKSKKRGRWLDNLLIGIGITGILISLTPVAQSVYTDYRSGVLKSEITELIGSKTSSPSQKKYSNRLQRLINVLERSQIFSMAEKNDNDISVMEMITDKDFERIFFNEKFISYCEQEGMSYIEQYNLAINFLRSIKASVESNWNEISGKTFDDIITETISYYNEIFKKASSINVFDNETAVFSIHSRNSIDGSIRFSSKGIRRILEILDITPYAFEPLELYETDSVTDTRNIEAFFDKIINFDKYGKEKGVFIFDGHGADDKFIYGQSSTFPYVDIAKITIDYVAGGAPIEDYVFLFGKYISVNDFANVLIKADSNGVNLGTKIFIFQDCHSDKFAKNLINILQKEGITDLPTIIVGTNDDTDIAYSVLVHDTASDGTEGEDYYVSSLELSIINYLQTLSQNKLAKSKGHLTLWQIASAPMIAADHTVYLTNSDIEELNKKYRNKIKELTRKLNIGSGEIFDVDKYTVLQSEKTVVLLEKFARSIGLKHPEEFRFNPIGVAIGSFTELISLWKKDFAGQHKNWTEVQAKALLGIKVSSLTLGVSTAIFTALFVNPVTALCVFPIVCAYEILIHFIYNEIVILTGKRDFVLQTEIGKENNIIKNYSVDRARTAIKESGVKIPAHFNLERFLSKLTVQLWLTPEEWTLEIVKKLKQEIQEDYLNKYHIVMNIMELVFKKKGIKIPEELEVDFINDAISYYNSIEDRIFGFEDWVYEYAIPFMMYEFDKRHNSLISKLSIYNPEDLRTVLHILFSKSDIRMFFTSDLWNLKDYALDWEQSHGVKLSNNVYEIIDFLSGFKADEVKAVLKDMQIDVPFNREKEDSMFYLHKRIKEHLSLSVALLIFPLSLLQTESTVKRLEKFARFIGLKNPERFRYNPLGVAMGVVLETFVFLKFFDTKNSPSFEKQHKNLTAGQKAVIWVIRAITVLSAAAVLTNPISNLLAIPAALAAETTVHFIYNEIQIFAGYKELVLQTEDSDDIKVYTPARHRRSDRLRAEYEARIKEKLLLPDNVRESAIKYLNKIMSSFGISSDIKKIFFGEVSGVEMYSIASEVQDISDYGYGNLISENYGTLAELEHLVDNFTDATNLGRKENGGYQEGLYVDLQGYKGEIIVIGDIHAEMPKLLQKIEANKEKLANGKAVIVFEGDYIHREEVDKLGEMNSSLAVIQFLMNLKIAYPKSVYLLAGNHDIGITAVKGNVFQGMAFYEYLNSYYGKFTDLLFEQAMRKNLALAAETDDYVIVHAGPIKRSYLNLLRNSVTGAFGWREYLKGGRRIQNIKSDADAESPHGQLLWGRYERDFTDDDVAAFTEGKILIHGHTRSKKSAFVEITVNGKKSFVGNNFRKVFYKISDNHIVIIDDEKANGYGVINQKTEVLPAAEQVSPQKRVFVKKNDKNDLYSYSNRRKYLRIVRFMMDKSDKYGRIAGHPFMLTDRGKEKGLIVTVSGIKNSNVSLRFLIDENGEIKILGFLLKNENKYGDLILSKPVVVNNKEDVINYLKAWNHKGDKYNIESEDIEYLTEEFEAVLSEFGKQGINLFQTDKTEKILFKIGKFLKVKNPEEFRFTPLGISIGVFLEPFVVFSSKFEEKHGNKITFFDEIERVFIMAADIASFVFFGRITGDIFLGLVVAAGTDFILHISRNIIKSLFIKNKKNEIDETKYNITGKETKQIVHNLEKNTELLSLTNQDTERNLLPTERKVEAEPITVEPSEEEPFDKEYLLFEYFYNELIEHGSCTITRVKAGDYYENLVTRLKKEFGNKLSVIERYQATLIRLDKELIDGLQEIETIINEGKETVISRSFKDNDALLIILDIIGKKYEEDKVQIELKNTAGLLKAEIIIHGDRFLEYSFFVRGLPAAASALSNMFDESRLEIEINSETKAIIFVIHDKNISDKFIDDFIKQYSQDDVDVSLNTESLIPALLKNANVWLNILMLRIISMFKVKPEVIAVVDAGDTEAILEAVQMTERGIKVKLIILNTENREVTEETGNVLDVSGTGNVFELAKRNGNLNVIKYEAVDGKKTDGDKIAASVLSDIKNKSIIGESGKKVLYISPTFVDIEKRAVIDEYIDSKVIIAASSESIKGAMVKALLSYGSDKAEYLRNMVISTENIYGSYKVKEINGSVLDELQTKGITNVMLDVTGIGLEEIIEKVNLIKLRKMHVVIYGENADELQIKGAETASYGSFKKGQRAVVDYGTEVAYGQNLKDIIVNIAKKDGENIMLTPDIIKRFIVMGASIAFDGEVLNEVSKETTAENGMTMLEIIKTMFADNPQQKEEKKKNIGTMAARKLGKVDITDMDNFIKYIKILRNIDVKRVYEKSYPDFIYKIVESSEDKAIVNDIERRLFESIDRYELLGILEGILQINELENILPEINNVDRTDNMNELLKMLVEYRILTGRSYDRALGKDMVNSLEDKSHNEILDDLRDVFKDKTSSDEDKIFAISGIIELLLMDNLQFTAEVENMLDMDIKNLHALLAAA